jgi:Tol biopolymer transport system component
LVARRRKIVFAASSGGVGGATDLFVMNADGSGITQITHTPNWEGNADWGPAQP